VRVFANCMSGFLVTSSPQTRHGHPGGSNCRVGVFPCGEKETLPVPISIYGDHVLAPEIKTYLDTALRM